VLANLSPRRSLKNTISIARPLQRNSRASRADQDPPSRRHLVMPSRQDRARPGARSSGNVASIPSYPFADWQGPTGGWGNP
jgi:hypothetical protein